MVVLKSPPHTSAFKHRALVAVEFVGFEFHRRSFAVHGQITVNRQQFFAVEIEFGGYKTDFRVFARVENIGRFQVLSKVFRTGLQFGQRQYDIDRALAFWRGQIPKLPVKP